MNEVKKMKKGKIFLGFLLFCFCLTGCSDMMNTPTKRVEEYLGKYQIMDHEVLDQLDEVLKENNTLTQEQKTEYKTLLEKQYQNLSYKIKNEIVDGDTAEVTVEISVFDFENAERKAEEYIEENPKEFEENEEKSIEKEMDYKIKQMKSVTDKIQYTISFHVRKDEEKKRWILDEIEEDVLLKIHGLYRENLESE